MSNTNKIFYFFVLLLLLRPVSSPLSFQVVPSFLNLSLRIGDGVLALFVVTMVEFACGLNDGVDGTSRFCIELVEHVETSVVSSPVVASEFPSVVKWPGSTIVGFEEELSDTVVVDVDVVAIVVSSKITKAIIQRS